MCKMMQETRLTIQRHVAGGSASGSQTPYVDEQAKRNLADACLPRLTLSTNCDDWAFTNNCHSLRSGRPGERSMKDHKYLYNTQSGRGKLVERETSLQPLCQTTFSSRREIEMRGQGEGGSEAEAGDSCLNPVR